MKPTNSSKLSVIRGRLPAVFLSAGLLLSVSDATAQYVQSNLVSDTSSFGGKSLDPKLIDPWGMVSLPGGVLAVANAHSGTITFYTQTGSKLPLEVTVPPAPGSPAGALGSPTGIVLNPSHDFMIQQGGRSAPAQLIVDTLDGLICGWNPAVDATHAVILVDNSATGPFPASYTALEIVNNGNGHPTIYAADSGSSPTTSNNQIAMYNGDLKPVGHFGDPAAPPAMTVFGVQRVDGEIYVTYAAFTPLDGGVVDIFDRDGHFLRRFAANGPSGPLEEPWAVVHAPQGFGPFGKTILVGNFTDGRINAYSASGAFLGQLQDPKGSPISSGLGLWALLFPSPGMEGQPLFFTTGVNNETDGIFGVIVIADRH
jgi:uncharacterized protein (TIGR03118 family)